MLEDELKNIQIPVTYKRDGKPCFYDPYRKRLINATSKELVIQKLAKLMESKYEVPKDQIHIDVPLSIFKEDQPGRLDFYVNGYDPESQLFCPFIVIGCVKEGEALTDSFWKKYLNYSIFLNTAYYGITNGEELELYYYDEDKEEYVYIEELPNYEGMIKNTPLEVHDLEEYTMVKFSLNELNDQKNILKYNKDYGFFGVNTREELRPFTVNFCQALYDIEHKLPYYKSAALEVIEDLGMRVLDNTNMAGGHYASVYRSFLIKDRFGDAQIVSFLICGTATKFRGEKRTGYTSLVVSIDDFKRNHNSLQYNVDRFTDIAPDGRLTFVHNGQMSAIKKELALAKVAEHGVDISVSRDGIEIGLIDCNKLFYLDDPEVAKLIYSLIEYALLREEVRQDRLAAKKTGESFE